MAEMSMNKVIHGAVRRDLRRFETALASFTDGDRSRAEDLGIAWDNFHLQLTHHHEGEHEIAWPAMRELGVSDELLTELDSEHDTMAAALAEAATAISAVRSSASAGDAASARAAIQTLREVTENHLDHEESHLEPVLAANQGSQVLKDMGRRFGRSMSPPAAGTYFAWLSDGATAEEIAAMTREVPKPVVTIFSALFGRSYRRTIAPIWR